MVRMWCFCTLLVGSIGGMEPSQQEKQGLHKLPFRGISGTIGRMNKKVRSEEIRRELDGLKQGTDYTPKSYWRTDESLSWSKIQREGDTLSEVDAQNTVIAKADAHPLLARIISALSFEIKISHCIPTKDGQVVYFTQCLEDQPCDDDIFHDYYMLFISRTPIKRLPNSPMYALFNVKDLEGYQRYCWENCRWMLDLLKSQLESEENESRQRAMNHSYDHDAIMKSIAEVVYTHEGRIEIEHFLPEANGAGVVFSRMTPRFTEDTFLLWRDRLFPISTATAGKCVWHRSLQAIPPHLSDDKTSLIAYERIDERSITYIDPSKGPSRILHLHGTYFDRSNVEKWVIGSDHIRLRIVDDEYRNLIYFKQFHFPAKPN